ncbi:MAG: cupin domain-containing protein [Actinomycetales bacterium]|nr:cupin domain-containing protein [Actinomycetales bacterium]
MRARIGRVLVMAFTVPFFLSSCSTNSAQRVIDEVNAYPLVSTLNGTVPPGEPTLVHTSQEILNVMRDGQQVRVYRDVREAGTRAPIHIHPFGGWTCVVSGQAVLYLDGAEPQETGPGECVDMPAMTPMSNVNPGPGPAVLLDSFVTPPDAPVWRIVEVGVESLGNEFATGHNVKVNHQ